MRRFIWALIAAALLISAAGCNRTDEPRQIQGMNESAPAATSNPAPTPNAPTTPVTVNRLPTDIVAEVDG